MTVQAPPAVPDYRPHVPADYRPGVGIIGCGHIVKLAHLPAYAKYGVRVAGVYDPNPEATRGVSERFPVGRVFASLDDLLADPAIEVVDVATHPVQRAPLIEAALAAGKHVLAQKPLAPDLAAALAIVEAGERRGLTIAVNQNGRWAPAWRIATLLIEQGAIGDVLTVTHLIERTFGWIPGTPFDELTHFAIYDYAIHWIDITRCWLAAHPIATVRARDYRTPNQPQASKTPWGVWIEIAADGAHAMIRGIGGSNTRREGHPFWIHGSTGTIRGSVHGKEDFVELEQEGVTCRYALEGDWFPDGFAATMGELLSAIAEGRAPSNSARDNLGSLALTFAACRSADLDGEPVAIDEETV